VRPRGRAMSARMPLSVRADASILSLGNFITDATVRLSHGRPSGHRPTVRPSSIVRVTTLALSSPAVRFLALRVLGLGCMSPGFLIFLGLWVQAPLLAI
jgi:hypothetical protein